jgi:hypothetical protein
MNDMEKREIVQLVNSEISKRLYSVNSNGVPDSTKWPVRILSVDRRLIIPHGTENGAEHIPVGEGAPEYPEGFIIPLAGSIYLIEDTETVSGTLIACFSDGTWKEVGGAAKLSQLEIDVDKDWSNDDGSKGIYNIQFIKINDDPDYSRLKIPVGEDMFDDEIF